MARHIDVADRRRVLQALALSAAWWTVPGAFAEQLQKTPSQTEGPFYPNHLPLDTDNDLLRINDALTPAAFGAGGRLSGRRAGDHLAVGQPLASPDPDQCLLADPDGADPVLRPPDHCLALL